MAKGPGRRVRIEARAAEEPGWRVRIEVRAVAAKRRPRRRLRRRWRLVRRAGGPRRGRRRKGSGPAPRQHAESALPGVREVAGAPATRERPAAHPGSPPPPPRHGHGRQLAEAEPWGREGAEERVRPVSVSAGVRRRPAPCGVIIAAGGVARCHDRQPGSSMDAAREPPARRASRRPWSGTVGRSRPLGGDGVARGSARWVYVAAAGLSQENREILRRRISGALRALRWRRGRRARRAAAPGSPRSGRAARASSRRPASRAGRRRGPGPPWPRR